MTKASSFARKLNATVVLALVSAASLAATAVLDGASAAAIGRGGPSGGNSSGPSGPAGNGPSGASGPKNGATFLVLPNNGSIWPCPIGRHCPPPPSTPVIQTQTVGQAPDCKNGIRWIRDYYGTWLRIACEPRVWPQEYMSSWNE